MKTKTIQFLTGGTAGEVSAILTCPRNPAYLIVLAHGAGGGIRTTFMDCISKALADVGAATFRYNFPYMEKKRKTPDSARIAVAAVRAAVSSASNELPGIPIIAAGKSYGGRMTSTAESQEHLEDVKGIVFFGFPLHPPGKPSVERAEHLYKVSIPMLFLQGSRDAFAELGLLKEVCKNLGKRAMLHLIQGGDHSFKVPKSSGKNEAMIMKELAAEFENWVSRFRL